VLMESSNRTPSTRRGEGHGAKVAGVLAGAWHHLPPRLEMSVDALNDITLGLLRSKTGALGWWRVRHSPLRTSAGAVRLREAYHNHGFQAALHSRNLSRIVTRLRSGGVEPLLVKGPAIGRLYPERGLRPFGDLDLCVGPQQYRAASTILRDWTEEFSPVDLHRGFGRLYSRKWDDIYARSQLVTLGGIEVRIPCPEDHLRFLCLHQLKHGAVSPLWLCDVAVALESRPANFDWDQALGPDRLRADWIACTIGLAHQLLGVVVDNTPVAERARRLPSWLAPSVLHHWGRQCQADYLAPELSPGIWNLLVRAPQTVVQYWPNPVAATIHLRVPFNDFPRMPIQVVDASTRLVRFCLRRVTGRTMAADVQ